MADCRYSNFFVASDPPPPLRSRIYRALSNSLSGTAPRHIWRVWGGGGATCTLSCTQEVHCVTNGLALPRAVLRLLHPILCQNTANARLRGLQPGLSLQELFKAELKARGHKLNDAPWQVLGLEGLGHEGPLPLGQIELLIHRASVQKGWVGGGQLHNLRGGEEVTLAHRHSNGEGMLHEGCVVQLAEERWGVGGFRVYEDLNLQILARQNPCHF